MQQANNVITKTFYEEAKEEAYKSRDEIALLPVPDKLYAYVQRYEKDWITNLISAEDVSSMRCDTPLFLVSQTGTGKTTFMFKTCLRVAAGENKRVLYLCSRKALASQIKEIAMQDELNKNNKNRGYTVAEMKEYFTGKGIEKEHEFGLLDIYTYQDFFYVKNVDWKNYSIVVLDEAHFFVSDASFNSYTEEILQKIVNVFRYTRRIYLTATPEESMDTIYNMEYEYLKSAAYHYNLNYERPTGLYIFFVDTDYSYINPFFFTNQEEIVKKIRETEDSIRWFIFIRSKESGRKLAKKLDLPRNDITYYDADTDKEKNDFYQELIQYEELKTKVTISTKVFDVGINVKTENLNIVLFEDNAVELKQMVGRKRIKAQEKVNVFFYVPGINEIKKRIGQTEKKLIEENSIIKNISQSYVLEPEHPVFLTQNGIKINHLSKVKLEYDIRYRQKLVELMSDRQENETTVYARWILGIFGINRTNIEKLFLGYVPEEMVLSRLKEIMDRWIGIDFDKDKFEQLSREVTEVLGDGRADTRSSRGKMGVSALNSKLAEYGYKVTAFGNVRKYRVEMIEG